MPIEAVQSSDTPNAGRVKWNNSDTSLQTEIDAAEAALNTHKSSADHDGRYYTEAEADARFAPIDEPLLTVHKSSADHDGRYYTEAEVDAALAVRDANLNNHKTSGDHDSRYVLRTEAKRRRETFTLAKPSGAGGFFQSHGVTLSGNMGILTPSPGCIVGALVSRSDGTTQVVSLPYVSSGSDRRFAGGSRLVAESITPGNIIVSVNGQQVTELSLTANPNLGIVLSIVVEYDANAPVGYEEYGTS